MLIYVTKEMKNNLIIFLIALNFCAFGQQKKYVLNWENFQTKSFGSYSIKIPSFNNEYLVYNFDNGLLFVDKWQIPNDVDESSITIKNIEYSIITKEQLFDLNINTIPSNLIYSLNNSISRDIKYAFFQISPIIKDQNGVYKKIMSFEINYSNKLNSDLSKKSSLNGRFNSVLNTGKWYRFYVDKSGVYKLSKSFLQGLGVDVNNVNPKTIKLYGNGGRMIQYANSSPQYIDIQENAIKFVGEEDDVFNNEDYILFYAQGPEGYEETTNKDNKSHINCYTDITYYYICISPDPGKRIQVLTQSNDLILETIETFKDYKYYEIDQYNIGLLGRRWFGDKFNITNNKSYTFNFPDLILDQPISMNVSFATISSTKTSLKISANNSLISVNDILGLGGYDLASEISYKGSFTSKTETVNITLDFNNLGNPSATGYLDYIALEAVRKINFPNQQYEFNNYNSKLKSGIGEIKITNASNIFEIWDITDIYNVSKIENKLKLSEFKFNTPLGTNKKYIAINTTDFYQPKSNQNSLVSNQNIKGTILNDPFKAINDIDYIIVAPDNMLNQANRLAQINNKTYGLNVKVYSLSAIYNEFSTGNQDIGAIRNLIKYAYDNASSPDKRIKYVCLFGDTSFDYKNKLSLNSNIVPSWYSYNSFSVTNSFVSDDFYGMMDLNEGNMLSYENSDIAVGRILANTPQQAKELVDKIEYYYSEKSFGSWRNKVIAISDDIDKITDADLQNTIENIANTISQKKPFMNVTKIHSDSYKQESSSGGNRYPQVNNEIANSIDNGALVINYLGHGGEEILSSERILTKPMMDDFRNFHKLNCFITITCEFGKFDNPYRQTGGEHLYWNKEAGSIALITTTRQVSADYGIKFNNNIGQYLFSYNNDDTYKDDEYPSIAEALRLTKNNTNVSNNIEKTLIFFIGDPAMKLAIPKPNIRLTKIIDRQTGSDITTLKALSQVKLTGEITDGTGNALKDYNGVISTTIFDKEINKTTLANDMIKNSRGELIKLNFNTLGEIIFKGQASIKNGLFEFDFVVPKDIGMNEDYGRISFYSENKILFEDKCGSSINTIKIGGINENANNDNIGPIISLYLNDENFISGGITNNSPILIAKMEDENGINTASGIGHDIVAILDGDETNPIILNDYYQTEIDNYKKGILNFPFRNLKPGPHTLTLRVWDVYNNSTTAEINFTVYDENEELVINNVLNYPNPFVNYTEFWFNHNSSSTLDVTVQIFTVSGKLIKTIKGQTSNNGLNPSTLSRDITWNGRDDFGEKIGKGVYVYKITAYSSVLDKKAEKIEKLVIL